MNNTDGLLSSSTMKYDRQVDVKEYFIVKRVSQRLRRQRYPRCIPTTYKKFPEARHVTAKEDSSVLPRIGVVAVVVVVYIDTMCDIFFTECCSKIFSILTTTGTSRAREESAQ
jgi:hypothetical protein